MTAAMLAGCASTGPQGQAFGQDPRDPLESFNRSMYSFNDGLDRAILRPVATGYQKAVPSPVRTGVGNFFGNLGDAWSFVNNVLQFKGEASMSSFFRVAVNSTFGLGGLLDVATEMRLERYKTDFGMTLGHWGVPSGPYLVLPFWGSSSIRDAAALPVDAYGNPLFHLNPDSHRYALYGLRLVDARARLLRASDMLDQAALDPYVMTRDLYLSSRNPGSGGDGMLDDDYDADAGALPDEDESAAAPAAAQ
ncbi:VacJ family lipoprotein [Corticibacter populi]|uniref:VacJ family lipoprotein n=2 Tax=Corticibacter populi TaxID=1550736 RepID=A0A3M6QN77_9BURK|nr:VacJ family lipoprotein [Corticibacter populi]RMX04191.1 VacJ family lipoprotein [Corticibacter populi]RZS33217.1 phospholipid-binding lipoprotein MlaA [Corticibacter populi]